MSSRRRFSIAFLSILALLAFGGPATAMADVVTAVARAAKAVQNAPKDAMVMAVPTATTVAVMAVADVVDADVVASARATMPNVNASTPKASR